MEYGFIGVFIIYLAASLFYILRLIIGKQRLAALALRITLIGIIVQTMLLGAHFVGLPRPWLLGYHEYYQLTALTLAVIFVVLCFTKRFYGSGPFFIIFIDVFYLLSLWGHKTIMPLAPRGAGYLLLHLITIFLSLAIFCIALVTAVMFLLVEQQIRHKRFCGIVARLPALASLDQIHYKALYTGFVLFTLSIITGAGYAKVATGHYIAGDPKQVLSLLFWFLFAVFLNLRPTQGWQGHRGIVLSLVGLVSMTLLFIVGLT